MKLLVFADNYTHIFPIDSLGASAVDGHDGRALVLHLEDGFTAVVKFETTAEVDQALAALRGQL